MTKCDKCYRNGNCIAVFKSGEKKDEQVCLGYIPICEYCYHSCETRGQLKGTKFCNKFKVDVLKQGFCSYGVAK